MKSIFYFIVITFSFLTQINCYAFSNGSIYGGIGYFSENNFGKETKTSDGAGSTFGTTTYPLIAKYDWQVYSDYFLAPSFSYTLFTRSSARNSATVSTWHLSFPVGGNINGASWDWSVGPGLLNRTIKGKGGTVVLNNGSSTAVFSLPGRSVSSQVLTLNFGTSYSVDTSRVAFDLIMEGAATSKRTFNFMLSYSYIFSGGRF